MIARYNAALVRYKNGHTYVDRSNGGRVREVFVEMGGVDDEQDAREIGARVLALYRSASVTRAVSGPVRTVAHVPGVSYRLGDRMGGNMIRSYSITLDGDGLVSVTPELDDPLAIRQAAIDRQLQRAAAGITSEYATPNITDPTTGASTDTAPPEFSVSGSLVPSLAPAWRAGRAWWCAWLDVAVLTPGMTATRVNLYREVGSTWNVVATAVIGAGASRALVVVNEGWTAGHRLTLAVATAGAGAADLTATLRGTMV